MPLDRTLVLRTPHLVTLTTQAGATLYLLHGLTFGPDARGAYRFASARHAFARTASLAERMPRVADYLGTAPAREFADAIL